MEVFKNDELNEILANLPKEADNLKIPRLKNNLNIDDDNLKLDSNTKNLLNILKKSKKHGKYENQAMEHTENTSSSDASIEYVEAPLYERDSMLYCFTNSLIPGFSNNSNHVVQKNLSDIRKRLAYDLDDKLYYDKFNYKKIFKKSELQDKLLNNKPIFDSGFRLYLSDYFNIDIIIICGELLIKTRELSDKICIVLKYDNNRFKLLVHPNGATLASPESLKEVLDKYSESLIRLESKSKYLLAPLKRIARALDIETEITLDNGKTKNKKKDDIYEEIKKKLDKL